MNKYDIKIEKIEEIPIILPTLKEDEGKEYLQRTISTATTRSILAA